VSASSLSSAGKEIISSIINEKNEEKRRLLWLELLKNAEQMEKVAEYFESHKPGLGRLWLTDKQKWFIEFQKYLRWAADPNSL
jgi:hypothetical protein